MREQLTVGLLAMSNVGTAVANATWVEKVQPYVGLSISLGQVAVATITVVYIWKKIQSMKGKNE